MKLQVLGIDLGKTVFHLVGLDSTGRVVIRKRCSRTQLLAFTANLQVQLIGMEACSGAHFLGRALRAQGHEVRLMPAQYVKPYVQTNKSDYLDAAAIWMSNCRVSWKTLSYICPTHSVFCWRSSNWNWSNWHPALRRWIGSSRNRPERMKPANDSRRFQESARSPRRP